jgi:hypothetical protein
VFSWFGAALSTLATTAQTVIGAINELVTGLANRVRVDAAQTFNATQQAQARTNIGINQSSVNGAGLFRQWSPNFSASRDLRSCIMRTGRQAVFYICQATATAITIPNRQYFPLGRLPVAFMVDHSGLAGTTVFERVGIFVDSAPFINNGLWLTCNSVAVADTVNDPIPTTTNTAGINGAMSIYNSTGATITIPAGAFIIGHMHYFTRV